MQLGKIGIAVILILLYNTTAMVVLVFDPAKISRQFVLGGLIISLVMLIAISLIRRHQSRKLRRLTKDAELIVEMLSRK